MAARRCSTVLLEHMSCSVAIMNIRILAAMAADMQEGVGGSDRVCIGVQLSTVWG